MPKLYLTLGLVSYIAAIAYAKTEDTPVSRQRTLLLSTMALGTLAAVMWKAGSVASFPILFPLATSMAVAFGIYTVVSRYIAKTYDRIMSNAAPIIVTLLTLYTIIPRYSAVYRHLDVLILSLIGLPLVYAMPYLFKNRMPTDLYTEALLASEAALNRAAPPGTAEYEYIQDVQTGARCGVFRSPGRVVIAFTPSNSAVDWTNTNLDGKIDKESGVHLGFLRAWTAIKDKVFTIAGDMILRNGSQDVTVLVTGHSLGGALAIVAAPDIMQRLDRPTTLVTFGAPPVGNETFSKAFGATFRSPAWRVVGSYDPIPKVMVGALEHPASMHTLVVVTRASTLIPKGSFGDIPAHSIDGYKTYGSDREALIAQCACSVLIAAFLTALAFQKSQAF